MDDDSEDEIPQERRKMRNDGQEAANKKKAGLQKAREKNRQKNICNRCGNMGQNAQDFDAQDA